MTATRLADIIEPSVFNPYVIQRTAELSALQAAGIISTSPELDRLATAGGTLINMPFWNDLDGDDEVLDDSSPLTPDKIDAGKDIAVLLMRGKAWGVNDLAKAVSGGDPMRAIGDLVAAYWARRRQTTLFSILKGVFDDSTMSDNVLDITGESGDDAVFSGSTFLDALALLGDSESRLTAVAMHSATYTSLRKQQLIINLREADAASAVPTYMGKRVIVDDGCPVDTGDYTTYLFGPGAFGLGNGAAPVPTEMDRDSLAGEDYLINRQHFLLHPRGVKFKSANVAGASPTNTELEDDDNWERVYDVKNVRIVQFVHKIA